MLQRTSTKEATEETIFWFEFLGKEEIMMRAFGGLWIVENFGLVVIDEVSG